jgi:hypothetical protein
MQMGSALRKKPLLAGLATTVLVASLMLYGYPRASPATPAIALHDEPIESRAPGGFAKLPVALLFYPGDAIETSAYVLTDVAVDEDFVNRLGDDWGDELQMTLDGANALLAPVGLTVQTASTQQWRSDDDLYYISSHISSAERQIRRIPGYLFLAITGQDTIKYDGWSQESGSRLIVQFDHNFPRRIHSLIAHEIGHLLGARHHEDEEGCVGDGCIMDGKGYAHATTWCEHHLQLIHDNIASALAPRGA